MGSDLGTITHTQDAIPRTQGRFLTDGGYMPKGHRVLASTPPAYCGCDFCGRSFTPMIWNERTCIACAVQGAPNQGRMPWENYWRALKAFQRARDGKPAYVLPTGVRFSRLNQSL